MSIRHYGSDVDEIDDMTYRMLDSRFCKVSMHAQRHLPLRHHREHGDVDRPPVRRARRERVRPDAD